MSSASFTTMISLFNGSNVFQYDKFDLKSIISPDSLTELSKAVYFEEKYKIRHLLRVYPEAIKKSDYMGFTPLHYACLHESAEMAALLINWMKTQKYIDVELLINMKSTRGFTPLMVTAMNGCVETAELLKLAGAILDEKDLGRRTILYHSISKENIKMTHWILSNGDSCEFNDPLEENVYSNAVYAVFDSGKYSEPRLDSLKLLTEKGFVFRNPLEFTIILCIIAFKFNDEIAPDYIDEVFAIARNSVSLQSIFSMENDGEDFFCFCDEMTIAMINSVSDANSKTIECFYKNGVRIVDDPEWSDHLFDSYLRGLKLDILSKLVTTISSSSDTTMCKQFVYKHSFYQRAYKEFGFFSNKFLNEFEKLNSTPGFKFNPFGIHMKYPWNFNSRLSLLKRPSFSLPRQALVTGCLAFTTSQLRPGIVGIYRRKLDQHLDYLGKRCNFDLEDKRFTSFKLTPPLLGLIAYNRIAQRYSHIFLEVFLPRMNWNVELVWPMKYQDLNLLIMAALHSGKSRQLLNGLGARILVGDSLPDSQVLTNVIRWVFKHLEFGTSEKDIFLFLMNNTVDRRFLETWSNYMVTHGVVENDPLLPSRPFSLVHTAKVAAREFLRTHLKWGQFGRTGLCVTQHLNLSPGIKNLLLSYDTPLVNF